jgi:hypothetical protein
MTRYGHNKRLWGRASGLKCASFDAGPRRGANLEAARFHHACRRRCGLAGCTDALLLGYGFKLEMIVRLAKPGMPWRPPSAFVAGNAVGVTRTRIIKAGGRALTEWRT